MKKASNFIVFIALFAAFSSCTKSESFEDDPNAIDESDSTAIDLGLSVKWARCNVGATSPEECGVFYAWGEIEGKRYYYWDTYIWGNRDKFELSKYCPKSNYGTVDGLTILKPEDDVAHVKWGGKWRMPTLEELQEMIHNCNSEWTTLNGVKGRKFTSRKNGNSIFLPARGSRYRDSFDIHYVGAYGAYWTSSLNTMYDPFEAYSLYFYSDRVYDDSSGREFGYLVRPVSK
ncbi:MAG: hypothetical protein KBS94_01855 [Prevotella sp.]|nr:hypothetical protein [Candidatus Equicola faecalis]